jgi:hypothetical protein
MELGTGKEWRNVGLAAVIAIPLIALVIHLSRNSPPVRFAPEATTVPAKPALPSRLVGCFVGGVELDRPTQLETTKPFTVSDRWVIKYKTERRFVDAHCTFSVRVVEPGGVGKNVILTSYSGLQEQDVQIPKGGQFCLQIDAVNMKWTIWVYSD